MSISHEEEFNTALGRRLSSLRKSNKMTLEHLGTLLGVSHQQVHKYETGESSLLPRRINICATVFNVPVGYFYGEDINTIPQSYLNKGTLAFAADVQELPEELRKSMHNLACQIRREFKDAKEDKNRRAA